MCTPMVCFQVNVQGAGGGLNHYSQCRPLYALGLDACLYRGKLKRNEAYVHKLLSARMRILLVFFISFVSSMAANIRTESSCCFWKCNSNSRGRFFCFVVCLKLCADYYRLVFILCQDLMKPVGGVMATSHCHSA
jgi:hypothetical protein